MREEKFQESGFQHITIGVDHDGCVAGSVETKKFPAAMLKKILKIFEDHQNAAVTFRVASYRQTLLINALGMIGNQNGCCVKTLITCVNNFKQDYPQYSERVFLSLLLMEDIAKSRPVGTHFLLGRSLTLKQNKNITDEYNKKKDHQEAFRKYAEWNDTSKVSLLYAHTHYDANINPDGKHLYVFFDDLEEILNKIASVNPLIFPDNTSVVLFHHDVRFDDCQQKAVIHGTGQVDRDYSKNVQSLSPAHSTAFVWRRNLGAEREILLLNNHFPSWRSPSFNRISAVEIIQYLLSMPEEKQLAAAPNIFSYAVNNKHEMLLYQFIKSFVLGGKTKFTAVVDKNFYFLVYLHVAVRENEINVLKRLLENAPDLSFKSSIDGKNVVEWAVTNQQWQIIEILWNHPRYSQYINLYGYAIAHAIINDQYQHAVALMRLDKTLFIKDRSPDVDGVSIFCELICAVKSNLYQSEVNPEHILSRVLSENKILHEICKITNKEKLDHILGLIVSKISFNLGLIDIAVSKGITWLEEQQLRLVNKCVSDLSLSKVIAHLIHECFKFGYDPLVIKTVCQSLSITPSTTDSLTMLMKILLKSMSENVETDAIESFLLDDELSRDLKNLLPSLKSGLSTHDKIAFILLNMKIKKRYLDNCEAHIILNTISDYFTFCFELEGEYLHYQELADSSSIKDVLEMIAFFYNALSPDAPIHMHSARDVCNLLNSISSVDYSKYQGEISGYLDELLRKASIISTICERADQVENTAVQSLFLQLAERLKATKLSSPEIVVEVVKRWLDEPYDDGFTKRKFLKKCDTTYLCCQSGTEYLPFVTNLHKVIAAPVNAEPVFDGSKMVCS